MLAFVELVGATALLVLVFLSLLAFAQVKGKLGGGAGVDVPVIHRAWAP